MYSINNEIAVEPFQGLSTAKTTKMGAISVIEQTVALIPVKVLFAYSDMDISVDVGDILYIPGNSGFQPWGKLIYKLDEIQFSLVPKSAIKLIKNVPQYPTDV